MWMQLARIHYYIACVRGSLMVPLVGNICTICTNLITNSNALGTSGTNVTNLNLNLNLNSFLVRLGEP